jgi:hypothetical protein
MIRLKPSNKYYDNNKMLIFCFVISVSLYFGIVTCVAGLAGVLIGSESARRYVNV